MILISISVEAFDAIASTLPLGSVGYEDATNEQGQRLIWLDRRWWTGCTRCGDRGSHSAA